MPSIRSKGKCRFCSGEYTKAGMTKHLLACKARSAAISAPGERKARQDRLFQLLVSDRYAKAYWMHIELPADAMLDDLDSFLRETWVECCGHLSAFRIGGTSFRDSERTNHPCSLAERCQQTISPAGAGARPEFQAQPSLLS